MSRDPNDMNSNGAAKPSSDRSQVAKLQAMLKKKPPEGETCDFCSTPVGHQHSHLIELAARRIMCACRPCFIVFEPAGAAQGKYRAISDRVREIADFGLEDGQWESLQIPIGLAFFFFNSLENRMCAFYPSPAGATESLLPLDTWDEIVGQFPQIAALVPDVQAVLVQRNRETTRAYVIPIDAAYELVGLIRMHWKGFDGGTEAHKKIEEYFARLAERARGRVTARLS